MKIVISAISKNEAKFVKRFCKSAKDADAIYIADTGSDDGTAELGRKCGAIVHDICITPWRFDDARNAALALIPRDVDVVVSLDLDEELQPGWREEIERVWQKDTTRLRYKFDWGCGIAFYYEKIFARNGYRFVHPCHEYPIPYLIEEKYAQTDMLLVVHKPDNTKSRGQYLDLLELSVKEDAACPRNAFYYARELTFHRRWIDAIVALNKYLENPQANWPNERCYAMRLLGQAYERLNDTQGAQHWLLKATAEAPNTREPWVELSDLARRMNNWQLSYDCAVNALAVKDKALVYTMDPTVWGAKPHDLLALSAYHLGRYDEAIEHGTIACELEPTDERLSNNLNFYREKA